MNDWFWQPPMEGEPGIMMIRGMVRKGDPFPCILAAEKVQRKASELHEAITKEVYRRRDGMTDQELEDLPRFSRYAYSSVRKRRTELFQAGLLIVIGSRKNNRGNVMQVWDLVGRHEPSQGSLFS